MQEYKPPAMEMHIKFNCWFSILPSRNSSDFERIDFFNKNHFAILENMYDPNWDNEVQIEEIFKKLVILYNFNPNAHNIIIERGEKKIYLPNKKYAIIPEGGVFVYDILKIKIFIEEPITITKYF